LRKDICLQVNSVWRKPDDTKMIKRLLALVDSETIYIAKLFVNIIMLCVFEIAVVAMVFLAFQVNVGSKTKRFLKVERRTVDRI